MHNLRQALTTWILVYGQGDFYTYSKYMVIFLNSSQSYYSLASVTFDYCKIHYLGLLLKSVQNPFWCVLIAVWNVLYSLHNTKIVTIALAAKSFFSLIARAVPYLWSLKWFDTEVSQGLSGSLKVYLYVVFVLEEFDFPLSVDARFLRMHSKLFLYWSSIYRNVFHEKINWLFYCSSFSVQ